MKPAPESRFRWVGSTILLTVTKSCYSLLTAHPAPASEQQGWIQKQVALELGIGYSNYNKMENGAREPSVDELQKLAKLYNITVDELLNPEETTPQEVFIADKTTNEQMRLIQELDEEDKQTIFRLIDKMLTNKKFKDFFKSNVAML